MNARRWAVLLLLGASSASAAAPDDAASVAQRVIAKYRHAATYRADGTLVVTRRSASGGRFVTEFEAFDASLDRPHGLRLSEHRFSIGNLTIDHTAWGPLEAIESYREDRVAGSLVSVEVRDRNTRKDGFAEFFTGASGTPPGWLLGQLLVEGKLTTPERQVPQYEVQQANGKTVLIQRFGQGASLSERRFALTPDGAIESIRDGSAADGLTITFAHQTFDCPVAAKELAFVVPEYAPAFDRLGKRDPATRKALLQRLAEAGNADAKVQQLLAENALTGGDPSPEKFVATVARLQQAEALGFSYAYVIHGQMLQADNRNWFPPELAALSDQQIRDRQRAVFLDGSAHCSAEADVALNRFAEPKLTAGELAQLKQNALACWRKFAPAQVQTMQDTFDKEEKEGNKP